jgi:hypothetical protein
MLLVSLLILISASAMAANSDGNGNGIIYQHHQSSSVPLRSQDPSKNQRLPPKPAPKKHDFDLPPEEAKKQDFDLPPEDARYGIRGRIFDSADFLI